MTSHSPGDLTSLPRGAHLCRFDGDVRELAQGAAAFVASGLAAGDRVLYVADDRDPEQVEASLEVRGVRAERALATGQLVVRTSDEVYGDGQPGFEDLEAGFRALHAEARADGLAALRVAAEMGDAAARFGSLERLVRWEAAATRLQRETGISTVCQYDCHRLSPAERALLVAEHAGTAPCEAVEPLAGFYFEPAGLRVVGEVDVSNSARFLEVLESRVEVHPRLDLDVAAVAFMDARTIAALFRLVARNDEIELTLRHAPPKLRRFLALLGLQHPRVLVA